jgi:hypothetical protein
MLVPQTEYPRTDPFSSMAQIREMSVSYAGINDMLAEQADGWFRLV